MNCKSPPKESYPRKKENCTPVEKMPADAYREIRQYRALTAIKERTKFQAVCLLVQWKGDSLNNFASHPFAAKGFLRCDLIANKDKGKWRRLLGTHKDKWISLKNKQKSINEFENSIKNEFNNDPIIREWLSLNPEPFKSFKDWRSRVYIHNFSASQEAQKFFSECPLSHWQLSGSCPLAGISGDGPWVLMQIHDVNLSGNKDNSFSKYLDDFIQEKSVYFKNPKKAVCLSPITSTTSLSQNNATILTTRIFWQIQSVGAQLHTGVSLEFAKAWHYANHQKTPPVSRNLLLRRANDNDHQPAILVSSLKGLWRSATAWLLEKTGREKGWADQHQPFTWDYCPEPQRPDWLKAHRCPVQAVWGGAGQEQEQTHLPGHRSRVRLYGCRAGDSGLGSQLTAELDTSWNTRELKFARKLLDASTGGAGYLKIETIHLKDDLLVTEIQPGPFAAPAFLTLCLAADLIGSGFFRLGRFTSRGFGIIRLKPVRVIRGTLAEFLDQAAPSVELANVSTGLELAKCLGFQDPLEQLAAWLQENFAPPEARRP